MIDSSWSGFAAGFLVFSCDVASIYILGKAALGNWLQQAAPFLRGLSLILACLAKLCSLLFGVFVFVERFSLPVISFALGGLASCTCFALFAFWRMSTSRVETAAMSQTVAKPL